MEKYNEIQLTKSKMDLNIQKITNHPPSPGWWIIHDVHTIEDLACFMSQLTLMKLSVTHVQSFY